MINDNMSDLHVNNAKCKLKQHELPRTIWSAVQAKFTAFEISFQMILSFLAWSRRNIILTVTVTAHSNWFLQALAIIVSWPTSFSLEVAWSLTFIIAQWENI